MLPVLSTLIVEPLVDILEPNTLQAFIVAMVSRESSTFLIVLFPFARDAKKIARCV